MCDVGGHVPDWRDAAAYAPLLDADRSLLAWEWLRRRPEYRAAADRALSAAPAVRRPDVAASGFGLVGFEPPHLGIPKARPLWRLEAFPQVLPVGRGRYGEASDRFNLERMDGLATLLVGKRNEHLLLSDGLRALRLDGPTGLFSGGPACLRYRIAGLAAAEPLVLSLRRFLAFSRSGRFARSLHPREARARRWILMLRTWDALSEGASQREIARVLLGPAAGEARWRINEPSLRSQAQRLVRSARTAASHYRALLRDAC